MTKRISSYESGVFCKEISFHVFGNAAKRSAIALGAILIVMWIVALTLGDGDVKPRQFNLLKTSLAFGSLFAMGCSFIVYKDVVTRSLEVDLNTRTVKLNYWFGTELIQPIANIEIEKTANVAGTKFVKVFVSTLDTKDNIGRLYLSASIASVLEAELA